MVKKAKIARRTGRARTSPTAGPNGRGGRPPLALRREQSVDFLQGAAIHQIVVRRVLGRRIEF